MRIFVGNLPYETSRRTLVELFGIYGEVMHVEIPLQPGSHHRMGFAIVTIYDRPAARRTIRELNGLPLNGRPLRVTSMSRTAKSNRT